MIVTGRKKFQNISRVLLYSPNFFFAKYIYIMNTLRICTYRYYENFCYVTVFDAYAYASFFAQQFFFFFFFAKVENTHARYH